MKNGLTHLPIGKNKRVIGLLKDKLGGKIMIEFVGIKAKMYAYLYAYIIDYSEHGWL